MRVNVRKLKALVCWTAAVSLCLHFFFFPTRPKVKSGHDTSQLGVIRRRNLLSVSERRGSGELCAFAHGAKIVV